MADKGGESVFSVTSADGYVENEPTVLEWAKGIGPGRHGVVNYFKSLFPAAGWLPRYNLRWAAGDVIAGITVGSVVVPQSMAYAKLANLPVQFGLYSSFMGDLLYWAFGTSKDITIGPVAVLSTLVGNVVTKVGKDLPKVPAHEVASSLAVITGSIVVFLGLTRLGWIVDFISITSISSFMTGSAINIAVGQVPTLMGITGFNTRDPTYLVVVHILKHLGRTTKDAAVGFTALFLLYAIRIGCSQLVKRHPAKQKLYFFISTLRTAFVILLYILISYLVNRHHRKKPKFSILGTVPRGFKNKSAPTITKPIIKAFASELPATVIVMLIEHISISKSFGRVNHYTINPSQELVAMGFANCLGPFLGAYPATGSFSRTAINSKAGSRTPLAGLCAALVVLLAIYALPAMFFYIPNAALSAVIIHAVLDLITSPKTLYKFWKISPLEVPIFLIGVLVTVFSSIENGIYTTVSISAALLFWRMFKAQGRFLGKVKILSVDGEFNGAPSPNGAKGGLSTASDETDDKGDTRNAFLPIDHLDGSNPAITLGAPYPGIFIFRFSEGFNYPNASHYTSYLTSYIFERTRRTNADSYPSLGDRPWNLPGPRNARITADESKPTLKAVILDFSSVNNVDVTSVQNLIDVRNQLDRYAAPDAVQWHFASITSRWTKRALASAGFGYPTEAGSDVTPHLWKPIFSVAEIGGDDSAARAAELDELQKSGVTADVEAVRVARARGETPAQKTAKYALVHGVNLPLFHVDLTSALSSAVRYAEKL